jgi:hypothetical protein
MKIIAGAFSLANLNTSRTMRGPSPRYFCTNSLPTTRMNAAVVWCATALASIVLPVPGGPYNSTPRGGSIPICKVTLHGDAPHVSHLKQFINTTLSRRLHHFHYAKQHSGLSILLLRCTDLKRTWVYGGITATCVSSLLIDFAPLGQGRHDVQKQHHPCETKRGYASDMYACSKLSSVDEAEQSYRCSEKVNTDPLICHANLKATGTETRTNIHVLASTSLHMAKWSITDTFFIVLGETVKSTSECTQLIKDIISNRTPSCHLTTTQYFCHKASVLHASVIANTGQKIMHAATARTLGACMYASTGNESRHHVAECTT